MLLKFKSNILIAILLSSAAGIFMYQSITAESVSVGDAFANGANLIFIPILVPIIHKLITNKDKMPNFRFIVPSVMYFAVLILVSVINHDTNDTTSLNAILPIVIATVVLYPISFILSLYIFERTEK